ncbi:MAG TPA: hypothetical protein VJU16_07210 [Planctomycetota bacterium]|nr:hypothetical protein [Planctomycetota bacterium]
MKPIAKFAAAGVAVAAVVALAAALYLRKSHEAVQRVVKPVELSAPDLFPATTLLYTEMLGWDKSYARAEEWWKRFETTASYEAMQRGWKASKLNLPDGVVKTLEKIDKELDRIEEKFGYRPTTRQFFETYGKHIAIGVLPSAKGTHPRLLLATRLPEDAPKALQGYLAKAGGVKPCDPPLHKGFPIYFEEKAGGGEDTVYYGVGRGYLFISDALPELKASLERLALATDGGKKPEGTLAHDPVLARVRPATYKSESGVIYIRRDQKWADWKPELAPVDEFIKNAFILAPKDEAVAFSLPDGPDGEIKSSFQSGPPRTWTKSLPQGLVYLQANVRVSDPQAAARSKAEADEFFSRPFWKELDAFLSDPKRVKEFLAEALPPDERPADDIAAKIPNDLRFFGAWTRAWLDSAVNITAPDFAYAMKVFPGAEGKKTTQQAFGIDLDPLTVFVIAGALDLGRAKLPEWIIREEKPGVLIWSLDMKRAMQQLRESAPDDSVEMFDTMYSGLGPSIIVSGTSAVLVLGPELSKEIAAILSGGPGSFEDDPLYVEARGHVRPGYSFISWDRPGERVEAGYGEMLQFVEKALASVGHEEEQLEFVHAGLETLKKVISWGKPSRGVLSALYPDAARPSESVELVDAVEEKKVPVLVPADAAARVPGFLPADTWLCLMQRLELKPSYDAIKKSFIEALPGGEERMKELTATQDEEMAALIDAFIEGFVRNLKGEAGLAIATPRPKDAGGPPGTEAIIARLPAFVAFAEFERPVDAFRAARKYLEKIHEAISPIPLEERLENRREWEGLPLHTELKVGMMGESRAVTLDIMIPAGEEYISLPFCVVERSGFLFVTNSAELLNRFGTAAEKDAGSLAARIAKSLPAGTAPEKVSSLMIFHPDTLIRQVQLYLDLLTPAMVQLTLRGYEEGPPPERMQAHLDGWKKWLDMALDLFRTKSWLVGSTSRTGNIVKSVTSVVAEK